MIKRSPWIVLFVFLASCGSSPPVDYYALQPIAGSGTTVPADARIIGLGPLEVPGYLDRPQLVTQSSDGKMNVDEFNRWAEPLADALPRVVTANVDALLENAVVVRYPYGPRLRADYHLSGRVIRFDADRSGTVVLEVQWGVQDAQANNLLSPRRSRYTAQASPSQDPSSIVNAMNETVIAFSRDVAGELTRLLESQDG
jgi:hypothetical protein